MKIIAFYLPQFHRFPENDKWWGKGFTEWTNVKNARPLFKGHNQPKQPLDDNYYNLLEPKTLKWQCDLAKQYGIYGFCYYHYWFDGKMLMQKPMELMLKNKEIDLPFCICWANDNWTRSWAKKSKEVLIGQTYGGKNDWEEHFNYLLPFFQDKRYMLINGKPIMIIYRPETIPVLREMLNLWDEMAKQNGFPGLTFVYQQYSYNHLTADTGDLFDYGIEYQPGYIMEKQRKYNLGVITSKVLHEITKFFHLPQNKISTIHYSYDAVWKDILNLSPKDEKMIPGAYVNWDNTPRYKKDASVHIGFSVEKFKKYLTMDIKKAKEIYHKDMIFMFAWNEWGEGGYLEPDKENKYSVLEAIKEALEANQEFPSWR